MKVEIEVQRGQRFVCQTIEVNGMYVFHKFSCVLNVSYDGIWFSMLLVGNSIYNDFDFFVQMLKALGRDKLILKTPLDYNCKEKGKRPMNDLC